MTIHEFGTEKAFSTDEYSDEDLQYVAGVLRFISAKTIWHTFESCNNYKMPQIVHTDCGRIEYWFGETEEKDRKWDIRYMRKHFPMTKFRRLFGVGHGGLAALQPKRLMRGLERVMDGGDNNGKLTENRTWRMGMGKRWDIWK